MLACGFFCIACTLAMRRLYAFSVFEVSTCHVHILGTIAHPRRGIDRAAGL